MKYGADALLPQNQKAFNIILLGKILVKKCYFNPILDKERGWFMPTPRIWTQFSSTHGI